MMTYGKLHSETVNCLEQIKKEISNNLNKNADIKLLNECLDSLTKKLKDIREINNYLSKDKKSKQLLKKSDKANKFANVKVKLKVNVEAMVEKRKQKISLSNISKEDFWENLLSDNTHLNNENLEAINELKQYYLNMPDLDVASQPIKLILHKIAFLKGCHIELTKIRKELYKNLKGEASLKMTNSELIDLIVLFNDNINKMIELHAQVLLWRVEPTLKTHNTEFLDVPSLYAIKQMEDLHIDGHKLSPHSLAKNSKITANDYTNVLNIISQYTNGSSYAKLAKMNSPVTSGCIKLKTVRHANIRYSTICPKGFSKHIVLAPPFFPKIRQGKQARYLFFRDSSIHLMKINSLMHEIQRLCFRQRVGWASMPAGVHILIKKIQELEKVTREHQDFIQSIFIENNWFNRIFRRDTLSFQNRWIDTFKDIKRTVTTQKINAIDLLIQTGYEQKCNHLIIGNTCVPELIETLDKKMKQLVDKNNFNMLDEKQEIALASSNRRSDDLLKINAGLVRIYTKPMLLKDTIRQLIIAKQLCMAKRIIDFLVHYQENTNKWIPIKIIGETYDYLNSNLTLMHNQFGSDLETRRKVSDILLSFDNFLAGTSSKSAMPSLYKKWMALANEQNNTNTALIENNIDATLCKNSIVNVMRDITKGLSIYLTNKIWKWPLSDHDILKVTNINDHENLQFFKENVVNYKLIDNITSAIAIAAKRNEKDTARVFQAILNLVKGNFSSFKDKVAQVKFLPSNAISADINSSAYKTSPTFKFN